MEARKQIYWEDMVEGQEIPSSYSLELNDTRVVMAVSGCQDFYIVHHDPAFARGAGHPGRFIMTGFMQGCFNRLIHDWIGDEGFLRKFRMEQRKMNLAPNDKTEAPGDTMTFKGKVTKKYVENSDHYIDADIWCENQREGITTPSKCTVILPSKS